MSFEKGIGPQEPTVQPRGKLTIKDLAFYATVGFFCLLTLKSITRIIDPDGAAKVDAEYAQQEQVNAQKAAQAEIGQKQKKEKVRAALLSVKNALVANAPSYMLSYSAANECIEIARAASMDAYDNDEDDMAIGFVNIQSKCSEWASLSWNAGRP